MSQSGRIAVVHNGIIENYAWLKEFLESKGIAFVSETDTEVVAQLLDYYYEGDLLDAVGKVLHRIEGLMPWASSAPTSQTGWWQCGRTRP